MRLIAKLLAGVVVLYLLLLGGLFAAMYQPPDRFTRVMAKVPLPLFRVVPFRQLWMIARGGQLKAGDPAPDFDLQTADRSSRVRLSSFRGEKPVVLIFGSYT